jgi:hypothetical protein
MTNLTSTLALSWIALSSVFRCDVPGEPVLFSDRPCQNAVVVNLKEVPKVQSVALTDSDLGILLGDEEQSPSNRSHPRLRQAKPAISRIQACADARADLRTVQMRRRKGYSLAEGVQLASQAQKHKDAIRTNC